MPQVIEKELNPVDVHDEQNVQEVLGEADVQQIKKQSVSGAFSYIIRTFLIQGIGLVAAALLGAYFAPEDFAVYGFVTQIISLLTFFSDVGLAAALVQKKSEPTVHDYRTAFTVQQVLSWVIVGVVLLVIASGVVTAKTGSAGVWILLSLALSFPLASLKTIPSIILERKLAFSQLAIPQIVEQVVFQGILIFLALRGMGATSYAYAIAARAVVGVGVMYYLQRWEFGLAFDKTAFKALIGFGAKFQLNDLLAKIKDQLFTIVLGLWMSQREFGYMQWSKNWSMYPYNLTVQNIMAITFPTFSRLQGHPDLLKKAIEKTLFFISLAIFPILIGMCVFIWPITQVVPRYDKWEPAVLSFVFFALSIVGAAISSPITNTLNALGKINQSLQLMIMWTVLTWIVTPIMMYFFGFTGVAVAQFLITITSVLPIMILKKYIAFDVIEPLWRQAVAAGIMAAVGVAGLNIWSRSWSWLLLGMMAVGATYLVSIGLLGFNKLKFEISSLRSK